MRSAPILAVAVTIGLLPACTSSSTDHSAALPTATVVVGTADPVVAEIATTPADQSTGLMGRAEVSAGTGMVFPYAEPVRRAFWMGNVEVPLSIVWSRDDTVVGVAEMQPCPQADSSCPRYLPDDPGATFDLAVETTGGAFTAAQVRVGDSVRVTGLNQP